MRCVVALVVALVAPTGVWAQSVRDAAVSRPARAPLTHVVLSGETLWRLAERYLGDGHRWQEIAALNRGVVSGARTLEAGTTIVLPAASVDAPATKVAHGAAALPAEGSGDDRFAPYAGRTVFFGAPRSLSVLVPPPNVPPPNDPASSVSASVASSRVATAPAGADALRRERIGAPWIDAPGGALRAGRVATRLDAPPGWGTIGERELHLYDRVTLTPPVGFAPVASDEFLAVAIGAPIASLGEVVVPRGVVRVVRADSAHGSAEGVVIAKFGSMEEGVLLLPYPEAERVGGEVVPSETARSRDTVVVRSSVLAVIDGALLPTVQHVVLVGAGTGEGVRAGDAVVFYRDGDARARARRSGGGGRTGAAGSPIDVEIARGRVMRVTPRGASVLIVQQSEPALAEGTSVRVVSRLP